MNKYKVNKGRTIAIALYVLVLVTLGALTLSSGYGYFEYFKIAAMIDKNIVVTATVTEVRYMDALSGSFFGNWYEYTDEGIYYGGIYEEYSVSERAQAYAQIGKKIELYIDGEGKISLPAHKKPAFMRSFTIAIIFTVLTAITAVVIIISAVSFAKRKKFI